MSASNWRPWSSEAEFGSPAIYPRLFLCLAKGWGKLVSSLASDTNLLLYSWLMAVSRSLDDSVVFMVASGEVGRAEIEVDIVLVCWMYGSNRLSCGRKFGDEVLVACQLRLQTTSDTVLIRRLFVFIAVGFTSIDFVSVHFNATSRILIIE